MPVTVKREDVKAPPIKLVCVSRSEAGTYRLQAMREPRPIDRFHSDGINFYITDSYTNTLGAMAFATLYDFKIFSAAVIEMMEQ